MAADPMALEAVEREAWLDMYAAAPPPFAAATGLAATRLAGAAGFAIRVAPTIEFNRLQGLGVEEPATEAALDAALDWLRTNSNPSWALQIVPEAVPTAWLEARGLGLYKHGWAKFFREPTLPPAPSTTLDIRAIDPEYAGDFGAVVQAGFGAPPPFAAWAGAVVGRPKWRCYVGYDGEAPVAAGALFIDASLGWLGFGTTLASHRGRGGQSALLHRRIADAVAEGVSGLVTETGRPAPGEEAAHPSFRNIGRAGFEIAYTRANYRSAA